MNLDVLRRLFGAKTHTKVEAARVARDRLQEEQRAVRRRATEALKKARAETDSTLDEIHATTCEMRGIKVPRPNGRPCATDPKPEEDPRVR